VLRVLLAGQRGCVAAGTATLVQIEADIAAQNSDGGGALAISGDIFVSGTAFTVDEVPSVGSVVDAPPRTIDGQTVTDR